MVILSSTMWAVLGFLMKRRSLLYHWLLSELLLLAHRLLSELLLLAYRLLSELLLLLPHGLLAVQFLSS